MKFAEFKNIAAIIIVLGLFGVVFWVSRLPYQENEPHPAQVSVSTAALPKPIFVVINSPTNGFVGIPSIQLNGHFVGEISNITYDVINSIDCRTNRYSGKTGEESAICSPDRIICYFFCFPSPSHWKTAIAS